MQPMEVTKYYICPTRTLPKWDIYAAIIKIHDALSKDMVLHVNPTDSFYPGVKVNVTGASADTIST